MSREGERDVLWDTGNFIAGKIFCGILEHKGTCHMFVKTH